MGRKEDVLFSVMEGCFCSCSIDRAVKKEENESIVDLVKVKVSSCQIVLSIMIDFRTKKKGVRMGMTRMGPITFQQPVQCRDCDGEGNEKEEIHPRQFLH